MEPQRNRKPTGLNPHTGIEACSIVADVLRDRPETIRVFLKRRLGCVGCELSVFDTVADVARIYRFDAGAFLAELQAAVRLGGSDFENTV